MLRCVGQMPGFSSAGTALLVYFNSADCAVEAARVVKAGGCLERENFPSVNIVSSRWRATLKGICSGYTQCNDSAPAAQVS
jgi:predicted enzyme related to lactoylglutathione lyase